MYSLYIARNAKIELNEFKRYSFYVYKEKYEFEICAILITKTLYNV